MSKMNVGDVNSQARGSGARDNAGKLEWAIMPLNQVLMALRAFSPKTEIRPYDLLRCAADFQEHPSNQTAMNMLVAGVDFLCWDLDLSFEKAMVQVVRVWDMGRDKYAAWNWMKGMNWSVPLNCAWRHAWELFKYEMSDEGGNVIDPESGIHHAAHYICNAMMLVHYVKFYPEGDDLPGQWFD